ncbi:MAG: hypothetical protein QM528_08100 [Phycisphaerales bacterium]|nr:hypothetical protein [Phycisphaerales bacterium]
MKQKSINLGSFLKRDEVKVIKGGTKYKDGTPCTTNDACTTVCTNYAPGGGGICGGVADCGCYMCYQGTCYFISSPDPNDQNNCFGSLC